MRVIEEKKLKISDAYVNTNNEMYAFNYHILKEMNAIYLSTLKSIFKQKNPREFMKALKEYDVFLDGYYEYDYYFNLNLNEIKKEIYDDLLPEERCDVDMIQRNLTLKELFDDFKYKKCDLIYMNMKFNSTIWEKSHSNATLHFELMNGNESSNKKVSVIKNLTKWLLGNNRNMVLYFIILVFFLISVYVFTSII